MNIIAVFGIALVGCALCVLLRHSRPEFAMLTSLSAGLVLFFLVLSQTAPVVGFINQLVEKIGLPDAYGQILLKSLGICFVTQLASDTCTDCGESAIASKVELAGKTAVLLVSLPLFTKLIGIAAELIQ